MKLKPESVDALAALMQSRRRERGATYADISRLSGVEQSQVHKICNGHFRSLTSNVMQICTTLDIRLPEASTGDYEGRLYAAVVALWDRTAADGDRLLRLLQDLREIRGAR